MKLTDTIFLLVIVSFMQTGCRKDKTITERVIGPQTLAEVKATILGTWKLHYSVGGYTGHIRVDFPDTKMQFTATDSVYRWDNGSQTIHSKCSYEYLETYAAAYTYSTYMIRIENPGNMMDDLLNAYAKKGDTLIIAETQHSNPEKYYLTKE